MHPSVDIRRDRAIGNVIWGIALALMTAAVWLLVVLAILWIF